MKYALVTLFTLFALTTFGQQKQYKVGVIGFYNLENLFDTIKSPDTWDDQFLPTGDYKYTSEVYHEKLGNLARVISELGTELTPDGVAILGVAEIENRSVLEDLVKEDKIASRNYQIVHYDSPDERGVDVGMIYNPSYFTVLFSTNLYVPLPVHEPGDTNYTRDVLWVYGAFDGDPMHIFVNHWPSRRGGEAASSPLRELAAGVTKHVIDSLMSINPDTKVVVMGDLNDDPVNSSVLKVLDAKPSVKKTARGDLFNPWYDNYKKGIGTLAWQDAWNLFDQVIISEALLKKDQKGYFYHQHMVHNKPYLLNTSGQYKGYPYRTYVAGNYQGGFSDHLPVFIYLLKAVN